MGGKGSYFNNKSFFFNSLQFTRLMFYLTIISDQTHFGGIRLAPVRWDRIVVGCLDSRVNCFLQLRHLPGNRRHIDPLNPGIYVGAESSSGTQLLGVITVIECV
jgi:hypothetical protein